MAQTCISSLHRLQNLEHSVDYGCGLLKFLNNDFYTSTILKWLSISSVNTSGLKLQLELKFRASTILKITPICI